LAGGTGFLPSYGAAGGATGSGLFGGGSAAAGSAAGAGAGEVAGGVGGGIGAGGAGALSYLPALPFAIALGGMLNGIFGRPDGPGYSARDRANSAANLGLSYSANGTPLYQSLGTYGDLANMPGFGTNTMNNGGGSLDMNHIYYGQDAGPVAAYLQQQYGNPNTEQAGRGLGGYSEDQYANAENYFSGKNIELQNYNPDTGQYDPGYHSGWGGGG